MYWLLGGAATISVSVAPMSATFAAKRAGWSMMTRDCAPAPSSSRARSSASSPATMNETLAMDEPPSFRFTRTAPRRRQAVGPEHHRLPAMQALRGDDAIGQRRREHLIGREHQRGAAVLVQTRHARARVGPHRLHEFQ